MTTCTTCGGQLADGAAFCTSCGTPVAADDAPAPTTPPAPAAEGAPAVPPLDPWAVAAAPPGGTVPPGAMPPLGGPPAGGSGGKVVAVVVGVVALLVVLIIGVAVALVVVGGGDDDEDAAPATTTTEEEPADEEPAGDDAEGGDSVDDKGDAAEDEPTEEEPAEEEPVEEFSADDGDVFADQLVVGHCVEQDLGFLLTDSPQFTVVDCAQPHRAEVFHTFEVLDGPYPDQATWDQLIDDRCFGSAFSDYVGTGWDYSQVYGTSFWPAEVSWDAGDRTVTCFLHEQDTSVITTVSYRNSGR
jgi:hypothetical protein